MSPPLPPLPPFLPIIFLPTSRYDRDGGGGRGYRESYRDGGGGYRDNYRDRATRDRRYGGSGYDDRVRDYRGGGRYDDYYDRYDYDRYRSGGYDHYPDHYYDERYRSDRGDYYGKYADYRGGGGAEYRGRSRSPGGGRGGDYYGSKDRSRWALLGSIVPLLYVCIIKDSHTVLVICAFLCSYYDREADAGAYRSRRW